MSFTFLAIAVAFALKLILINLFFLVLINFFQDFVHCVFGRLFSNSFNELRKRFKIDFFCVYEKENRLFRRRALD